MPDQPTPEPSAAPRDEQPDEPGSDPAAGAALFVYDVTGAPDGDHHQQLHTVTLPRRHRSGSRGVLLVDRPAGVVHLLDAIDGQQTFRYRETRPIAGSVDELYPPDDDRDNLLRAAYETAYDVIAAPWAAGGDQ